MASRSSTIPSMHIKLSRPGGETRRTSFPRQPSWPELETRIATLFGIPLDSVAVTYEDSDGDIVTLSSQEELVDYLAGVQRNEPVKFNVINTKEPLNSSPSTARPSITENASEGIAGGITSLGPTMIYELDEPEWQRIPGMPNVFSMREPMMDIEEEPHAFVEVIDSEANSPKKGSATPVSVFGRLRQEKGKGRAESEQTKSTSSASIVEDDVPFKSAVHVYDAHGAAIVDPIGLGSGQYNFLQINATTHAIIVAKGISPQTTPRQASTLDLETPPPGALPTQTTGGTATGNTFGYSEPPSFIGDVAHLVDGLTRAFASHPELSEGLRNIVKNTVEGVYWEQGSRSVNEAIHNAAQETSANINRSARDLATHSEEAVVKSIAEALGGVFRVIGDITSVGPQGHHRPHSAHHGRPHHHHRRSWHSGPPGGSPRGPPPSEPHHGSPHGIPRDHLPPPPSLPPRLPQHPPPPPVSGHHVPPHPPPVLPPPPSFGIPPSGPPFHYGPPPRGPPFHGPHRGGPFRVWSSPFPHRTRSGQSPPPGRPESPGRGEPPTFHHGDERGNWPHSAPMHGDPFDRYRTELPYYGYRQRPHDNLEYDSGHYRPQHWDMDRRGAHMQDGSWGAGYDQSSLRNVHESKAQLETAKAVYKAEKERFREEKEERRRLRREYAERRAEEGHPATE